MSEIWFVGAKRTAFGSFAFGAFGGALKDYSAADLGTAVGRAALEQAGVAPANVDEIVFGNVQQTAADSIYLARHIGLRVGVPETAPALIVNRMCGSGFEAIVAGAKQILLGEAEIVLAGGIERTSQPPRVQGGAKWNAPPAPEASTYYARADKLGRTKFGEMLWDGLTDSHVHMPQGVTTEYLAEQFGITREQSDVFALRSQKTWAEANQAGRFKDEILPLEVRTEEGTKIFATDEAPRRTVSLELLGKLPAIFRERGVVTIGNSAPIGDGAAAVVMCSAEAGRRRGLRPLGRLTGWGIAGCDPRLMGMGPAYAIRRLLDRRGQTLADYDLFEINEAFATSCIAVQNELALPEERLNVDGGAVALGHPYGASGARITAHLLYALGQRSARRAIGSACIGGGQGIALSIEAPTP